jgi:hypothetical protein
MYLTIYEIMIYFNFLMCGSIKKSFKKCNILIKIMLKIWNKHLILWKDIFKLINWPMQNCWYMYMRVLQYWPHWWYKVFFNKVLMSNYNTFILMIVSLHFTINVINLTRSSFVPWFRILSQYGTWFVFLLGFGRVMQYLSTFYGECKYPKMTRVLQLNSIILFKWYSSINVKNFTIPSFIWINMFGMI